LIFYLIEQVKMRKKIQNSKTNSIELVRQMLAHFSTIFSLRTQIIFSI